MSREVKNPSVTVVVPVYCSSDQHEVFLREALESVACQSFRDFEVILVDDVSPRDIGEIVRSVRELPRVSIIRNDSNAGHAVSRNIGVRAAKGEMIAFLDHDDLWLPEKLARQVDVLRRHPDVPLTFCRVEVFGPQASRLEIDQSTIPERPGLLWLMYRGNYLITATAVLVRKSAIEEIGMFDHRYTTSDDFDAWLKILERHPIIYINDKLARYRLHSENVNYGIDRWNDSSLLLSLYLQIWRRARMGVKIALLPKIVKKSIGKCYYYWRRKPRHEFHRNTTAA